jgi:transaldolase
MKLYIDTANLEDIEWGLKSGIIRGVTTNPSLLAKEPKGNYIEHLGKIVELMETYVSPAERQNFSFSVEVFSNDAKEILKQTDEFLKKLAWPGLAIKLHIDHGGKDNLALINELSKKGVAVNCTACMTVYQAMTAAAAGARFVSLFWCRIKDGGQDERFKKERSAFLESGKLREEDFVPGNAVKETRTLLDRFYPDTEIIAGSIRNPSDVKDAALAGSHIVTVQPKTLKQMLGHYKTDEVVDQFLTDFKAWMS